MTTLYSQEQINEIAVFVAEQMEENNQSLKDALQKKIDELKPVESPESDAGSGTPPASGGETVLDDGTVVKQKLIVTTFGTEYQQYFPHGLEPHTIIGLQASTVIDDNVYQDNSLSDNHRFSAEVNGAVIAVRFSGNSQNYLPKQTLRFLLTYVPTLPKVPNVPIEVEEPKYEEA